MKFGSIHLIRLRVDNARVFQRVSKNFNMTVGQAACRLLCRYTLLKAHWLRRAFAESYLLLHLNQAIELITVGV